MCRATDSPVKSFIRFLILNLVMPSKPYSLYTQILNTQIVLDRNKIIILLIGDQEPIFLVQYSIASTFKAQIGNGKLLSV